jgi:hypothetical protein
VDADAAVDLDACDAAGQTGLVGDGFGVLEVDVSTPLSASAKTSHNLRASRARSASRLTVPVAGR